MSIGRCLHRTSTVQRPSRRPRLLGQVDRRRPNGEGSVTWDETAQRWVARLPRDERGRRAKISAKTKTEVVAKLRQRLREREAGLSSAAGRMTVRQYLEGWVRDLLPVMNLADSSKAQPRVDGAIASGSGARSDQAAQAEPGACAAVHREELNAGKGPRTIQLAHNTLRTALKQAEL
jgi:hypothetical protein